MIGRAGQMTTVSAKKAVFGYGSLVNTQTHSLTNMGPTMLTGWRRHWVQAAHRPVAFLSIEPHPTTLHGIALQVAEKDWGALDAREAAYLRRDVNHHVKVAPDHDPARIDIVAYEANPDHTAQPSVKHPILLSYLDVVVQGYTTLMGPDGAAHFFDTTAGWGPVLNDRDDPLYPRAQPLPPAIRDTVDAALSALSVAVQPPERALVDAIRNA